MEAYTSKLSLLNECASKLEEFASEPLPHSLVRSDFIPNAAQVSTIATFNRTFEVLQYRVQHIQKLKEYQDSLLSPFRKLPDEVLCEIFSHMTVHNNEGIVIVEPHGIWSIRQVCARWRSLVNSTPKLWSKFSYGGRTASIPDHVLRRRTQLCLQYSRSALLSVSVTPYYTDCYGYHEEFPREVFDDIMDHASHLYKLTFDIHIINQPRFRRLREGNDSTSQCRDFSQLRILHIEDTTCRNSPNHEALYSCNCGSDPYEFFKTATMLEEVDLQNVTTCNVLRLPWGNVKILTVSGNDWLLSVNGIELLGHIPQLQSLTWMEWDSRGKERINRQYNLASFQPSPPKPSLSSPITLPALRNLHLCDMGKEWATMFLVPQLTSFKLSHECIHYTKAFISMIRRSGCTLTSVELSLCHLTDAEELLQTLSDVEELILSVTYMGAGIKNLEYLIWNPEKYQLLPRLKKFLLTIKVPTSSNTDVLRNVLTDVIRSRSIGKYPNKSLNPLNLLSVVRLDFHWKEESVDSGTTVEFENIKQIAMGVGVDVQIDCSEDGFIHDHDYHIPIEPEDY